MCTDAEEKRVWCVRVLLRYVRDALVEAELPDYHRYSGKGVHLTVVGSIASHISRNGVMIGSRSRPVEDVAFVHVYSMHETLVNRLVLSELQANRVLRNNETAWRQYIAKEKQLAGKVCTETAACMGSAVC